MQKTSIVVKIGALAAIVGFAAVIPMQATATGKVPATHHQVGFTFPSPKPQPTCPPPVNTNNLKTSLHPCPV